MKVRPLGNRILVRVAETAKKSAGGLDLVSSAQERSQHGEIVSVGDGDLIEKARLKVGDTVMYGKYNGTDVKVDGEPHRVLDVVEVFAVMEG